MRSFKSYHLSKVKSGASKNLGIIIFKPGYSRKMTNSFHVFCQENTLKILKRKKRKLSRSDVIALYPKIFSFSPADLIYGIEWKQQTIDYLTSGPCVLLLVDGKNASRKIIAFKHRIREDYGRMSRPKKNMPKKEFFEKVVKNVVHSAEGGEVQNALWLFPI